MRLMEPDAKITYEVGPDPTGRLWQTIVGYRWEGGEVARLTPREIRQIIYEHPNNAPAFNRGDTFPYGPFVLRVIDDEGYHLLVSQDGWKSRLRCQVYPIIKWFSLIHYRLLQTAHIWNLIDIELGCVITWADLRVVKKSKSLWRKIKPWNRIWKN